MPARDARAPAEISSSAALIPPLIRLVGVGVLLAGLYAALQVVTVAWELFHDQSRVTRLAGEMEKQSGVNTLLHETLLAVLPSSSGTASPGVGENPTSGVIVMPLMPQITPERAQRLRESAQGVNVVYFFAWGVTLVLLFIIARISLWAVHTGGILAIADPGRDQLKQLLRELLAESRSKAPRPGDSQSQ